MQPRNPYDFRNPARPELLVGRDSEIEEIERHLAGATDGRPVHLALLGERAAGKTSILDAVEPLVREYKHLPVRVNLDEGATSNAFTFFKTVFEAVVQQMVSAEVIHNDDPRYVAWRKQVHAGDTTINPSEELLQFGMIAASFATGADPADISASLLSADFTELIHYVQEAEMHCIVLLIDEANLIGESPAIIQKLRNLVQAVDGLMLILSGTTQVFASLREVFSPIPRQFVRIPVEPFESLPEVVECVTKPLLVANESIPSEAVDASLDIFQLTNGRPYEINLVCYHIWQALMDGQQDVYEVTPFVLDNMLRELLNMGRLERQLDADEIDHIRRLSSEDFEVVATVLAFEGYTLEEHVRARFLPKDFTSGEFQTLKDRIKSELSMLEGLGIVELVADRFRLRGGSYARAYLKFAARHHAAEHSNHDVIFERPYAIRVVTEMTKLMLRDIFQDKAQGAELLTRGFRHHIGDTGVNRKISQFQAAIDGQDIARMASVRLVAPFYERRYWKGRTNHGLLFAGFVFSVTIDKLEHALLLHNSADISGETWQSNVNEWIRDKRPLLDKYLASVDEFQTTSISTTLADDFFLFINRGLAPGRAYDLFVRGRPEDAEERLLRTIQLVEFETYEPDSKEKDTSQKLLATMYSYAAFMALFRGDISTGNERLDAVDRLKEATNEQSNATDPFNRAFALAVEGRFEEASEFVEIAQEAMPDAAPSGAIMLMHLPLPSDWVHETPRLGGQFEFEEVSVYLELHKLMYRALAGLASAREELENFDLSHRHPASLRVLAWARFYLSQNDESARQLLAEARENATQPFWTEIDRELAYVSERPLSLGNEREQGEPP